MENGVKDIEEVDEEVDFEMDDDDDEVLVDDVFGMNVGFEDEEEF